MTEVPTVKAPPATFRSTPVVIAALLAVAILAADLATTAFIGLSSLYLIPVLLIALSGPPRSGLMAAWTASILVIVGFLKVRWDEIPWIAFGNRAIALAVIWVASSIAYRFRETTARLEQSTREVADISYAIEQSAIVAVTDVTGRITFANDKFCEISKYSRDELIGQDHRLVNSGYHSKEYIRGLWHTIANGQVWRGELRNRAKDGTLYWVDTTIVPFLDERGKPIRYMAIRYDVTDRKRSEELLREQAALARLGQMAAVVAHEVKNPIAGIRGALQVIASRMPADQRDRGVIGEIIERLDALNGIVQDLLLFARPRQVRAEPVDIFGLVSTTVDLLRRDPMLAGVTVDLHGAPLVAPVDAEQVKLVLQNVVINAAQALAGTGRIDIAVERTGEACRVAVADTGPGMPEDVREKAFDAFFTTKHRGTGLGLPIARRVVESHGGGITIDPSPGGGTVVAFTLPLAR